MRFSLRWASGCPHICTVHTPWICVWTILIEIILYCRIESARKKQIIWKTSKLLLYWIKQPVFSLLFLWILFVFFLLFRRVFIVCTFRLDIYIIPKCFWNRIALISFKRFFYRAFYFSRLQQQWKNLTRKTICALQRNKNYRRKKKRSKNAMFV